MYIVFFKDKMLNFVYNILNSSSTNDTKLEKANSRSVLNCLQCKDLYFIIYLFASG